MIWLQPFLSCDCWNVAVWMFVAELDILAHPWADSEAPKNWSLSKTKLNKSRPSVKVYNLVATTRQKTCRKRINVNIGFLNASLILTYQCCLWNFASLFHRVVNSLIMKPSHLSCIHQIHILTNRGNEAKGWVVFRNKSTLFQSA